MSVENSVRVEKSVHEPRNVDQLSRVDESHIQAFRMAATGTRKIDKLSEMLALKEEIKVKILG